MSAQQRKILWPAMIAVAVSFTAILWASARTKTAETANNITTVPPLALATQKSDATLKVDLQSRLVRQPEVFKLNRLLGQRLKGQKLVDSALTGTLTVGAKDQQVSILRRQDEKGEGIEVFINNKGTPLTWNAQEGTKVPGKSPTESERFLVDRLTLDSPDQFVLAQLRGASYYIVARNVRPEGVTDDYAGPLWNVVRVDEPPRDEKDQQRSGSRLYYINTATGLIDRIVSQEQEEAITAELSNWTEINGEKVPLRITWRRQDHVVMQLSLTTFSQGEQK